MCRLCEKDAFIQDLQPDTLEYIDLIIHIMRFGPYSVTALLGGLI